MGKKKNKKKKKQKQAAAQAAASEQKQDAPSSSSTDQAAPRQAPETSLSTPGGTEPTNRTMDDVIKQTAEQLQKSRIQDQIALRDALMGYRPKKKPKGKGALDGLQQHAFWNTQPVVQTDQEDIKEHGPIETKTVDQVRANPYLLPAQYTWAEIDMNDPVQVEELYQLLRKHYVEDDDNMFRFNYSKEFLCWALKAPGYTKNLHVAVRVASGARKMVACITGIPVTTHVYHNTVNMVEINFLCVHKKLRAQRLAPVLIKEVTRRVNLTDTWQAVYTAGVVLPRPIGANRYYHRSLNPKKLIAINFSRLAPKQTLRMVQRLYKVADKPKTPGIRALQKKDIPQACKLLSDYLSGFDLHVGFTEEEFEHWFMPREGVIDCYVVENPDTKELTDMISFYTLPSSILRHPKHNELRAAYSFYNVAKGTSWNALMTDALIIAHSKGYDVFNALDVMENKTFLQDLKFGIGDGNLQYYLYNWMAPKIESNKIGLVLL